jgi:hypothetical protein
MVAKLSTIVRQTEWASKLKVLRTEVFTQPLGYEIVMRMADGTDRYARSDIALDIDWTPPSPELAAHYRAIYEYHR